VMLILDAGTPEANRQVNEQYISNLKTLIMKKIVFITLLVFTGAMVSAQTKIRLNLYSAYVFDDSFDEVYDANTYFRGTLNGGYQWGGGFEFVPHPYTSIEIMYLHKSTDAPIRFNGGTVATIDKEETLDVNHDYIMLVGNGIYPTENKKVEPYAGFMGGIVITNVKSPTTGGSDSHTNFAWGGRLGTNIWFSEKVGLKLQAQILAASRATGGDVYYGYWGPVVLDSYTTLWQFGLGGGLTFRLGH
jgi:hypothetical protein